MAREAMRAVRPLLVFFLLGASAGVAQASKGPIVTTDIVHGTYEMLYDVYALAWKTADVDGLIKKIPLDAVKKEVDKQWAALPPPALKAIADAEVAYVQIKALAMGYKNLAFDAVEKVAVGVVDKFEAFMPKHKGKIGKTLPDIALFAVNTALLLYVSLKIFLFAWGVFTGIFCCLCCCRCGGSRGKADAKSVASKGKAAAKAAAPKAKSGGKK